MQFKLLAITTLAATALADFKIFSVMKEFDKGINDTNDAVANWNGAVYTVFPLVTRAAAILKDATAGIVTTKAAAAMSHDEATQVAALGMQVLRDTNRAADTGIAAKPRGGAAFKRFLGVPSLKVLHGLSAEYAQAIIEKTPDDMKAQAQMVARGIDDAFMRVIDVYSQ